MKATKEALKIVNEIVKYYIENVEDIEFYSKEKIESIKNLINSANVGCECDPYFGYDCGCGERNFLFKEALKELEKVVKL